MIFSVRVLSGHLDSFGVFQPLLGHALKLLLSAVFQNMHSDTKLTATDATGAKTPAISASSRPESNGRHPGPGFGQQSGNENFVFTLRTRAFLGDVQWQQ